MSFELRSCQQPRDYVSIHTLEPDSEDHVTDEIFTEPSDGDNSTDEIFTGASDSDGSAD